MYSLFGKIVQFLVNKYGIINDDNSSYRILEFQILFLIVKVLTNKNRINRNLNTYRRMGKSEQ